MVPGRNQQAVTLLEMLMGLMVAVPLVLLFIDLILITMAVQVNDAAAVECVRIAASGDPNSAALRVNTIMARINKNTGGFVSGLTLGSLTFTPSTLLATEATMIPNGGTVQGSVTVVTKVTVKPMMVSAFSNGPLVFSSSQSCPVTYVVPNTAGGQIVPP